MNPHHMKLAGNVSNVTQAFLYQDCQERVTVSVEGAEPLYAELRLRNQVGWAVGQKVVVVIVPEDEGPR